MNNSVHALLTKRGVGYGMAAGLLGAALLWLMTRVLIHHAPLYDELLHFLAAQGIRATGEPIIDGGHYHRAWVYTQLVAASFSIFGETLLAARVPALMGAMLLQMVLAVWVTRRAGLLAGAASCLFICLIPVTTELAVFARFYTLHALTITVMAVLIYEATAESRSPAIRIMLVMLALGLTLLGWHFQDTTLIAAGALACATASVVLFDRWTWVRQFVCSHPIQVIVAITIALVLGMLLVAKLGLLDKMGQAPLWNDWAAGRPNYYLMIFAKQMPLLWPLFPVAIGLALIAHPRLTIFSTVVLLSGLTVHSIAAAKMLRYVYYLMPFFCIVWGCALSSAVGLVRAAVERTWHVGDARLDVAALAVAAMVLAGSTEGQGAAKLLVGKADLRGFGLDSVSEPDWNPIQPTLSSLLAGSNRLVTSNAMKALYYLGRYDYELNASIVPETDTGEEFGVDTRTGGRAIAAADSTRQVISLPGRTLVVLEDKKINVAVGVPSDAMQVINHQCEPVELPAQVAVHAWTCSK